MDKSSLVWPIFYPTTSPHIHSCTVALCIWPDVTRLYCRRTLFGMSTDTPTILQALSALLSRHRYPSWSVSTESPTIHKFQPSLLSMLWYSATFDHSVWCARNYEHLQCTLHQPAYVSELIFFIFTPLLIYHHWHRYPWYIWHI